MFQSGVRVSSGSGCEPVEPVLDHLSGSRPQRQQRALESFTVSALMDDRSVCDVTGGNWRGAFRDMVRAERDHQIHLDELRRLNLSGWLERHFLGDMALYWQGWERRYWSWDGNSIVAWADASRTHCYAQFPVSAKSAARRVSPEEQVKLGKARIDGDYSITPKPFVFTIENTAFDLLFACKSEEELQLWLDKISVTLHPLKYSGRTYKAPAKYIMQKNTNENEIKK
eukprot:CAMPEP_0117074274 /NCGR_PEP_ID=MMETSP0472-20121206/52324_1 /TAXON_ID=693140 ORGANISM="Tiarina fusus, Strain LIS" /NCGR_SAMPLE_ID=MMETSP0472 /ASSEMBLY_ACC=CAM_ASM_000603 /LENGTH=226 /DNA_ID=CAMNT_0004799219 /DNA_START=176 /DNA_END=854 /DNA_ORIENTATION=+